MTLQATLRNPTLYTSPALAGSSPGTRPAARAMQIAASAVMNFEASQTLPARLPQGGIAWHSPVSALQWADVWVTTSAGATGSVPGGYVAWQASEGGSALEQLVTARKSVA